MHEILINLLPTDRKPNSVCTTKHIEDESGQFYCALGSASFWDGDGFRVGTIIDLDLDVYIEGGPEFYAEVKACKAIEEVSAIFYRELFKYLTANPAAFVALLGKYHKKGINIGREQVKKELRDLIGVNNW